MKKNKAGKIGVSVFNIAICSRYSSRNTGGGHVNCLFFGLRYERFWDPFKVISVQDPLGAKAATSRPPSTHCFYLSVFGENTR